MKLLLTINIKFAMLAVAIAGLLLTFSFAPVSFAQTDTSTTTDETTQDDTSSGGSDSDDESDDSDEVDDSDDSDESDDANDDSEADDDSEECDVDNSGRGNSNFLCDDVTDFSPEDFAERREEMLERVATLRGLVEKRREAIAEQQARFAGINNSNPSGISDFSEMTLEERRTALLERVEQLQALVAERRAAIEARQSTFGEQRTQLMERVQALRDRLEAVRAARGEDVDEESSDDDSAEADDDSADTEESDDVDDDHEDDHDHDDDDSDTTEGGSGDDTSSSTDATTS